MTFRKFSFILLLLVGFVMLFFVRDYMYFVLLFAAILFAASTLHAITYTWYEDKTLLILSLLCAAVSLYGAFTGQLMLCSRTTPQAVVYFSVWLKPRI